MTWAEFKKRAEDLGVQDSDQIGIDAIDDEGRAVYATLGIKLPPVPTLLLRGPRFSEVK